MKLSTRISLVAVLLASGVSAQAACVYPQAPQNLPNGATATKEQMLLAKTSITDYQKAVEGAYLPCLDQEKNASLAALDPADPDYAAKKTAIEDIHAKKYNAAVDELTAAAGRFNDEIKAFKAQDAQK
jgi:hypothetical protein